MDLERSNEEVLIERAVMKTLQILYDKRLFDEYAKVNEVWGEYLPIEINQCCRPDLDPINDDVIQWFYPKIQFKKHSNVKQKSSTNPSIFVSDWCRNLFKRWTIYNWCRNR